MKHTPGPWNATCNHVSGNVLCADGTILHPTVALIDTATTAWERNAKLIAAAPEMLAALRELVAEFDEDDRRAAQEQGHYGLNETGGIAYARTILETLESAEA